MNNLAPPRHTLTAVCGVDVALAPGMVGMHNLMLEVKTIENVGAALDLVNEREMPLAMSFGRDSNDAMTSFYVCTPSGFAIEYGTRRYSSWKLLSEGGFLRALQPKRWGGGEVTLLEFFDVVVEISRAAPSAGWVAGVIGAHPWQLALFADQAQQEMWADDPARMHSSSYNPTGKAEPVGVKVWGRWSFSSGCDHCEGVNLGAIAGPLDLGDGNTVPEFRSFVLFPDQYRIEDNWYVAGPKGTGSKDIVVEETFVPSTAPSRTSTTRSACRCLVRSSTTARSTGGRGRSCSTW